MMSTNESKTDGFDFDGTLAVLVQDSITPYSFDLASDMYFFDPEQSAFCNVHFTLADTFTGHDGTVFLPDKPTSPDVAYLVAQTRREIAIKEIVYEGRLKIALLIDSPGGRVDAEKRLKSFLHSVRSRKGIIEAYGGKEIASAAADIFMTADRSRRYITPSSSLMFHLDTGSYYRVESMLRRPWVRTPEGKRNLVAMRRNLLAQTCSEQREKMAKIFAAADKKNDDCRIDIDASAAESFGFAEIPAHGGEKLRDKFEETFGIPRKFYDKSDVGRFFRRTDVADRKGMRAA